MTFAFRMSHDPRLTIEHLSPDLACCYAKLCGIPGDIQSWERSFAGGSAYFGFDPRYSRDLLRDVGVPVLPFPEVGLEVAASAPHFNGTEYTYDLFLAYLHGSAETVVRRAVLPSGANQIFPADQQAGGLRSA